MVALRVSSALLAPDIFSSLRYIDIASPLKENYNYVDKHTCTRVLTISVIY